MGYLRILPTLAILIGFFPSLFAQKVGGNPPSIKWNQVNIPAARIIFPKGLDSTAARVANVISWIQKSGGESIGNRSRKINILLQNQTVISNGYVGLAPFRSEFFLTPPQNSFELGSLPWPDMLALHEFRHVEQYSNFDVGLSRVMSTIFGDGGQALANSAAVPDWFFEGDAVFYESTLSKQGRGNLPSFFNGFKAIWEAQKNFNWMQLRNGSLKFYTPSHYELGYMLVAYGREKYGKEFWKKVTLDAASYKGLVYPFQKAIKIHSGISYNAFRKNALNYFKDLIEVSDSIKKPVSKSTLYLNEQFPAINKEGDIIYLRESFDEIPIFINRRKDGSEEKIRVRDYSINTHFKYKNGRIVYVSYRPDLRWGNKQYNEIKVLDINSGKQRSVTENSRHFSPDINVDGSLVVAVKEDDLNRHLLQVIETESGRVKVTLPNSEGLIYTHPVFTDSNKIIAAVRDRDGKMSIAQVSIATGETNFLVPFTYNVIGFPVIYKDTLYYSFSYLKEDELFAYTFLDKKSWKIETPEVEGVGKYAPSVNEEFIAWHTFTANGNKIITLQKNRLSFNEIPTNELIGIMPEFGNSSLTKTNANLLTMVPDDSFTISKYRKTYQLFNFHSIIPDISDPNYTLSLAGENVLNTFQSELALTYNTVEKYKRVGFSGTYSALFPYLSGGVNVTLDRRLYQNQTPVFFNQVEPYAGISIPLNLSRGRNFTYLNAGTQYVFNKSFFKGAYKDSLAERYYGYLNNYVSFTNQVQKAAKQIYPRFAQVINGSYKTAVTNYSGQQTMINASIFLPGLFKNTSLVFNGGWLQKDSLRQISFSSGFPFSRGYEGTNFYQMFKWGVNYHFPLSYPDVGVGNIIYVLRIRANVFYDDTGVRDFKSNREGYKKKFRSAGTEISLDTKWWNQVKVSFGFRYSYLFDQNVFGHSSPHKWEIILPVNLFNQ